MRNIRLIVAYDGTAYCGWQLQPAAPTVQGAIEGVLAQLTQAPCRLRGAGRTDAGVHAEGQVANFLTMTRLDCHRLLRGLDALLPRDIAIRAVDEVALEFDARRDNHGKHYRYLVFRPRERDVACCKRAWHVHGPLDLSLMARAATRLIGRHDFAAFRAADCERETTIRTISRLTITEQPPVLRIDVEGTAFLKNMVRIITGTLVELGRGRHGLERIDELLATGDRRRGGATAPAQGLTMMKVFLP